MKTYTVFCKWHQNTSRNGEVNSESGLTYRQAKDRQGLWACEQLPDEPPFKRFHENSVDTGDCTIGVVPDEKFHAHFESDEIEYYEMFW